MISSTNDENGGLTLLGSFTGQLALGISLSRLVYFSILIGIPAEGIVIAASLAQAKSPYRQAIPLIHSDPDVYNEIVRLITVSQLKYDGGLYSQPLMYLQLYAHWTSEISHQNAHKQFQWCAYNGLVLSRIKQFEALVRGTCRRVSSLIKSDVMKNNLLLHGSEDASKDSKYILTNSTINKIRLLLTWTSFKDNLFQVIPLENNEESKTEGVFIVPIKECKEKAKTTIMTAKNSNNDKGKTVEATEAHFNSLFTNTLQTVNIHKSKSYENGSSNNDNNESEPSSSNKATAAVNTNTNAITIPFSIESPMKFNVYYTGRLSMGRMILKNELIYLSTNPQNVIVLSMLLFSLTCDLLHLVVAASTMNTCPVTTCPFIWASEKIAEGGVRNVLISVRGGVTSNQGIGALLALIENSNMYRNPMQPPSGIMVLDAAYISSICDQVDRICGSYALRTGSRVVPRVKRVGEPHTVFYLLTNVQKVLFKKIVTILEEWNLLINKGDGALVSFDAGDNAVLSVRNAESDELASSNKAHSKALLSTLTNQILMDIPLKSLFFMTDIPTAIAVQEIDSDHSGGVKKQSLVFSQACVPLVTSFTPLLYSKIVKEEGKDSYTSNPYTVNCLGAQLLRSSVSGYRDK